VAFWWSVTKLFILFGGKRADILQFFPVRNKRGMINRPSMGIMPILLSVEVAGEKCGSPFQKNNIYRHA